MMQRETKTAIGGVKGSVLRVEWRWALLHSRPCQDIPRCALPAGTMAESCEWLHARGNIYNSESPIVAGFSWASYVLDGSIVYCTALLIMSILTAATAKPGAVVGLTLGSDVISNLGPLLSLALRFQQMLSTATLVLFIRTIFAARLVATALFLTSRLAALQALIVSRTLTMTTASLTTRLCNTIWDSKRSRRLRKKLEFELFTLILGPGGNALLLLLFWPGWLLLGAIFFGLRAGVS